MCSVTYFFTGSGSSISSLTPASFDTAVSVCAAADSRVGGTMVCCVLVALSCAAIKVLNLESGSFT